MEKINLLKKCIIEEFNARYLFIHLNCILHYAIIMEFIECSILATVCSVTFRSVS